MIATASNWISELAGTRGVADAMGEALQAGQSAAVVTPSGARGQAIADRVSGWLFERRLNYADGEVSYLGEGYEELARVLNALHGNGPSTLDGILTVAGDAGIKAVVLKFNAQGERLDWTRTGDFLEAWARLQRSTRVQVPAVCAVLVAPGRGAIPKEDANLRVMWGHRVDSALDVRLFCRANPDARDPLRTAYRDHVLPSVAGADVALAEHLWANLCEAEETVVRECVAYGETRGWSGPAMREAVRVLNSLRGPGANLVPDQLAVSCEPLWALGYIQWSPEYGTELHSAAQALLGRPDQVRRRIWRGQSTLMFPLLNHLRAAVCHHLTTTYGSDWPNWAPLAEETEKEFLRASPSNCQMGHLTRVLDERRRTTGDPLMGRLYVLARTLRDIRNELAHYRPIAFRSLVDLRRIAADSGAWADELNC